ncbi:MAG: YggS family pyridoxal phosphate-dependent enzyme, partial [Bacteroidota bacterium]
MSKPIISAENYRSLNEEVTTTGARLVAVSKTHPIERIQSFYTLGHRDFGENRVQEVVQKQALLPKDIRWHFIGHLQRNKVKQIAPFIDLIHSVDSLRLLLEINKEAAKNERIIDVLLQFHVAEEDSKYGLDLAKARDILRSDAYQQAANIRIVGVMGMATFTDAKE